MELQVKELTRHKQNMTNVEIRVETMSDDVSQMTRKIREYDETINTYSDMCDDTKSDQTISRNMIEDLTDRVGKLEFDYEKLQPKVLKMSNDITDLQCRRSMMDNLILYSEFQKLNQLNEPKVPRENQSTVKAWR